MSYDFKIVNGDWSISNGQLEKVEDTDKLIQDLLKMIHYPLGKNRLYPWYGCPIADSMVGTVMDTEFVSTMASTQLASSIEMLQKLQKEQAKIQSVSPFELIAALKEVSVQRSSVDYRYYSILVNLFSKALKQVSVKFLVNTQR